MKENILKRTVFVVIVMLSFSSLSFGQLSEEPKKLTPDLPGEIVVDFGFNIATSEPVLMDFNWFRSKSLGIYFVKPFDLGQNISFRPGIGLSLEKLGTTDPFTVNYVLDEDDNLILGYEFLPGEVKKSQLALNFLEIPVEMRYNFGGNEGKGSVYIGLGGSLGLMVDGHTKIKHEILDQKIKEIRYNNFSFDKTRIGAFGKVGYRSFGLFYKYYFTDVFNSSGPADTEDTAYWTVGMTIAGF